MNESVIVTKRDAVIVDSRRFVRIPFLMAMPVARYVPMFLGIFLTAANAQAETWEWEGVWAQSRAQCICGFYTIDMCPEGKGMPPLLITRKKFEGPEISCKIRGHANMSKNSFDMRAICSSEGVEAEARIRGSVINQVLTFSITGPIEKDWSQGDYNSFPVKCPR